MTSFGVNSILRITDGDDHRIVLVKRSKYMANMQRELWHVTMNEGLNLNDIADNTVNLNGWVRRGFVEELGINDITRNLFCTLFLNRKDFEVGITSIADASISIHNCIRAINGSKDGWIENVDLDFVIDDCGEIEKFIKKHKNMTGACRHSLLNYISKALLYNNCFR